MSGGFWAPDGAYARFVLPIIGLVWVVVVSRVLARSPATRAGWWGRYQAPIAPLGTAAYPHAHRLL